MTTMLMHRVVMAGSGAVVVNVLIVSRRRDMLCRAAGAAEKHGRSRKALERDRYQKQASQEHAELGHCGDSNDCRRSADVPPGTGYKRICSACPTMKLPTG